MKMTLWRSTDDEPSESEVEDLVKDAERYTLANHLFWGLWGIISVSIFPVPFLLRKKK